MNRIKTTKIVVSGKAHITSYEYDGNGNLTMEKDWLNNTYASIYDPLNRLIEKRDPYNKTIQRLEYNNNHAQVIGEDVQT